MRKKNYVIVITFYIVDFILGLGCPGSFTPILGVFHVKYLCFYSIFFVLILGGNLIVSKFPTTGIRARLSGNKISSLARIDVEKFDGQINFGLRLIWSLLPSYEHMKPILINGKEKIIFSEVTSKLLVEERRLISGRNFPSENLVLFTATGKSKNFTRKKAGVC